MVDERKKELNGIKTEEIRKRFPKDFVGWIYLYVTKGSGLEYADNPKLGEKGMWVHIKGNQNPFGGKVVARFWCDRVDTIEIYNDGCVCLINHKQSVFPTKELCLTEEQICDYIGYGDDNSIGSECAKGKLIHISKLEIFDEPKELSEFYKIGYQETIEEIEDSEDDYLGCECYELHAREFEKMYIDAKKTYQITKAPQSWQYIYTKE